MALHEKAVNRKHTQHIKNIMHRDHAKVDAIYKVQHINNPTVRLMINISLVLF